MKLRHTQYVGDKKYRADELIEIAYLTGCTIASTPVSLLTNSIRDGRYKDRRVAG